MIIPGNQTVLAISFGRCKKVLDVCNVGDGEHFQYAREGSVGPLRVLVLR